MEHSFVPVEERDARLAINREFVLDEAFGKPLYRPKSVVLASSGEIFVIDAGNARIVVFDSEGEPVREFGKAGQGPGEFGRPAALGIVGHRVVVYDASLLRISVYTTSGVHIDDYRPENLLSPREIVGLDEDLLLVDDPGTPVPLRPGLAPTAVKWAVRLYSSEGTELQELVATEHSAATGYLTRAVAGLLPIVAASPQAALSPGGLIYATTGTTYRIVAFDPSGSARWVLQTGQAPEALTDNYKTSVKELVLGNRPGDRFVEVSWPEHFAAIANLETDDEGRLYVFPYVHDSYTRAVDPGPASPDSVPVDIYSSDGTRLFVGMVGVRSWDALHRDLLCRIETDPGTAEETVACYRMALPFQAHAGSARPRVS